MSKPTVANSRWDTDGTNMSAPSSGQRDTGIVSGAAAVSSYINYLLNQAYLWAQYVDAGLLEGAFGLTSVISPSAITGTNTNYAPTNHATASEIRQDLSAAATITSLAGGAAGRILILRNLNATYDLKLLHDDGATGTAANRFSLPGAKDLYLVGANSYAILKYDGTLSRWVVISTNGRQPKELWIAGASFNPYDSANAHIRAAFFMNTSGGSIGAGAGVNLPEGTRITACNFHVTTSSNAGARSVKLISNDLDGTDTDRSTGSDSTISSNLTIAASSALPYTMTAFPHTVAVTTLRDDDIVNGVHITYY